jgi:malto-oligosyltrehalose synthase/4-alpha-glucanotransferase
MRWRKDACRRGPSRSSWASMAASDLEFLCQRFGIAADYIDIWGKRHPASETTRRALLQAMGVDTASGNVVPAALEATTAAQWRQHLPPVRVARFDLPQLVIDLTLPASRARQPLHWRLIPENGDPREGTLHPSGLEVQEQREIEGEPWVRCRFPLSDLPPAGYHRLELQGEDLGTAMPLILVPGCCYQPEAVTSDNRTWGFAVPLFCLRSRRNWGIGDFTDLTRLLEFASREGAGIVGVNPLHALFPHAPDRASPYSPSSRLFLNVLYLDVEAVTDFAESHAARELVDSEPFKARLRALRAAELVDYPAAATAKREVLELLYRHFRDRHLAQGSPRARDFRSWQHDHGDALHRQALYDALQERFHREDPEVWGWPVWPEAFRNPASTAVAAFAEANGERVEFFQYLQWLAELQLDAVGRRALDLRLGVGLCADLAIAADIGGAEVWANQALYATGARIGAPPDDFNLRGQNWGLPPWIPYRLREAAYRPFITLLRQNMRAAGALRIDHVMALLRLFWIPEGSTPEAGTYVHYPLEDLLGILALESQRNRCLVIGEDLGTVPEAIREALRPLGVLSYRLLYFEKDTAGNFKAPPSYEKQAVVMASTHDLPTLAGFWAGTDLEQRQRLGLFTSAERYEQQIIGRAEDRARLLLALQHEGLLPEGMSADPVSVPELTPALSQSLQRYLARTPARLLMIQPQDLLGETEQVNLPGTTNEYPNWRRRLWLELEQWGEDPDIAALMESLRAERGVSLAPAPLPARKMPPGDEVEIPRATYRLQLHRGFTFADATRLVPYLAELGISHCYCSPYLKARPGSLHGYDIIDHSAFNPEIGTREDFERFVAVLAAHHMGHILDMVPNHMGVMGRDNRWWLDVLENGPASRFAEFFDIDWSPLKPALRDKVLLPVLGDHYGNVVDRHELALVFTAETGAFSVDYYDHCFPVDPRVYPLILERHLDILESRLPPGRPSLAEFQSLITAFGNLPRRSDRSEEAVTARARDKELLKQRLAALVNQDADIHWYLEELLREFNGTPDYPVDTALMHELLDAQAYRLAYWRVASDEINYRRFFDIDELASLRMENPEVFEATHELVMALITEGKLQGLRIDHPDGLYDPAGYFARLQMRITAPAGNSGANSAGNARPLYVIAEKILSRGEELPSDWPVYGTTGYEFVPLSTGLFIDTAAAAEMERIYADFLGARTDLEEIRYLSRRLIMQAALASELNVLANQLDQIAEADPHTQDFTLNSLRFALLETVACFPVYRTYLTPDNRSAVDTARIEQAITCARRRSRAGDLSVFDFLREVLLMRITEGRTGEFREQVTRVALHLQQYTAPVMAKGVEDTAFYLYNRLVCLNEVGADPAQFGVTVEEFHRANVRRLLHWPHGLICTTTHDTKRAEDVRLRIAVLSEIPDLWELNVRAWAALNQPHKRRLEDVLLPEPNTEYLLYQTLLGTWPLESLDEAGLAQYRERIQAYMLKASREAKRHTSWINPDTAYEEALQAFVALLLDPAHNDRFLETFLPFKERVARAGLLNSLAQTLIKLTAPGVPDIYQGTELWDFSLVDPDNRRPVDFDRRRALLERLSRDDGAGPGPPERLRDLLGDMADGRFKLYLIRQCLALRRQQPALFRNGTYIPLAVQGSRAAQLCSFARHHAGTTLITAVPRLLARYGDNGNPWPPVSAFWEDTEIVIPAALACPEYHDLLTGEDLPAATRQARRQLPVSALFETLPVALLCSHPFDQPGHSTGSD